MTFINAWVIFEETVVDRHGLLALHALLQGWIILRMVRRGVRDLSATPSRKRCVPSS
jgi:hypothetical protein